MTDETKSRDADWPRGFDVHQLEQLRRLAALPLSAKLEWLEEAERLAARMQGQPPEADGGDSESGS